MLRKLFCLPHDWIYVLQNDFSKLCISQGHIQIERNREKKINIRVNNFAKFVNF